MDGTATSPPLPLSAVQRAWGTRRGKSFDAVARCLERGEIVQVADDGGIVVRASPPPGMHAPGERAQLVGRRFDRIDAGKAATSGGWPSACLISEPIGRTIGGKRRRLQTHLDTHMRAQPAARCRTGSGKANSAEKKRFSSRLMGSPAGSKPASARAARIRSR